ncbi:MAG: hypothetical protein JWQ09_1096 [Segetibacter sp.]|nr:hypothetical protein [Segetibacter sp.]
MKLEETYKMLTQEWDEIAEERYRDLSQGNDKSYDEILKPKLLSVLKDCDLTSVIDVGCGVGVFTEELGKISEKVIAIDVSCKSIEIAKTHSVHPHIFYKCVNFTTFTSENKFTLIVSNMTLMTVPDIENVFIKIKSLLSGSGSFVFTITHPSFWPIYWNYFGEDFDYKKELEVVTEFRTRDKVYKHHQTRHYHRPISFYINLIISHGLVVTKFLELKGKDEVSWYPRFLLVKCINNSFGFH